MLRVKAHGKIHVDYYTESVFIFMFVDQVPIIALFFLEALTSFTVS